MVGSLTKIWDVATLKVNIHILQNGMADVTERVNELDDKLANVEPRVGDCEMRLAVVEDNLDENIREQKPVIPEEFPVETTLVCSGLREDPREDIPVKTQDLICHGLGLVSVKVERAVHLASRNNKPGLIKIQLPTKDDQVAALRCKRNLNYTGYLSVYLRSFTSHTDGVLHQNFMTILKELPNGDKYRATNNGKLVTKDEPRVMGPWARGPPVVPVGTRV